MDKSKNDKRIKDKSLLRVTMNEPERDRSRELLSTVIGDVKQTGYFEIFTFLKHRI